MSLVAFELKPDDAPLPAAVSAFLADAEQRIARYLRAAAAASTFVPCAHEPVYRALRSLWPMAPGRRLCEWGSGFGVVAGLGASLGYEAHGIEVDRALVVAARELLLAHRLHAEFWPGSFVPEAYARSERFSDLETRTVLSQADVYGDMDLDIDDFDVVYAYPWPTEEALYRDLFRRFANPSAVLLTFSRLEGVRAYRKLAGGRGSPR